MLCFIAAGVSLAQETKGVDARQNVQRERIREGVVNGDVTKPEAVRFRADQRRVRRAERRAKADGDVNRQERKSLHRKQNKVSRDIGRQKNDGQSRD